MPQYTTPTQEGRTHISKITILLYVHVLTQGHSLHERYTPLTAHVIILHNTLLPHSLERRSLHPERRTKNTDVHNHSRYTKIIWIHEENFTFTSHHLSLAVFNHFYYIRFYLYNFNLKIVLKVPLSNILPGRAVAQAVSRWLPTAVVRFRIRAACGACGGQSGIGAGFLRVLLFPLPVIIPPNFPSS
jgi:hypothetical protein